MYTVAVVTGARAEYGLLRPVLRKIEQSKDMRAALFVTGAHLAEAYGYTVKEIEADAFSITARLDILSPPAPPGRAGTAARTALALQLFLDAFSAGEQPDAVLLLGDRYETFAAGQAAALLQIPLVHISGGDATAGADDEWFRHCLTKMAKLHFPSCEKYRERVIRMGEVPGRVFNVGGLGDENIRNLSLLSAKTLFAGLGLPQPARYALVTLHPETLSPLSAARQADIVLAALGTRGELFCLFTAANADAGGEEINRRVQAFCQRRGNAAFIQNLGTLKYLSAMRHAAVVVGNSSSGVVETPSLGVPAVDIGRRQEGRERPANVRHCAMEEGAVAAALDAALSPAFAGEAARVKSPYNGGNTSGRIATILAEFLQNGQLAGPKLFYDGGANG